MQYEISKPNESEIFREILRINNPSDTVSPHVLYKFSLTYCRIQRNWRLGLSLSSEARCGRIFLKLLHNDLALIYIHFCQLENFSDQRRFLWNVEKIKWSGFLEYFGNGQLERNFL